MCRKKGQRKSKQAPLHSHIQTPDRLQSPRWARSSPVQKWRTHLQQPLRFETQRKLQKEPPCLPLLKYEDLWLRSVSLNITAASCTTLKVHHKKQSSSFLGIHRQAKLVLKRTLLSLNSSPVRIWTLEPFPVAAAVLSTETHWPSFINLA